MHQWRQSGRIDILGCSDGDPGFSKGGMHDFFDDLPGGAASTVTILGVVVICSNEDDRFKGCLASLQGFRDRLVYVDSGSSDDSIEVAQACTAAVVELDLCTP